MKIRILLLSVFFASVANGAPRFYDVNEFAIEGVKLGMTLEEARAAALKSLRLKESAFDAPADKEHVLTGEKFPSEFMLFTRKNRKIHTELRVLFIENILDKENSERSFVVNEIRLTRRSNDENRILAREYVKENFGEPTTEDGDGRLEWCDVQDVQPNHVRCLPDKPHMSLTDTLLVLENPEYYLKLREYLSSQ